MTQTWPGRRLLLSFAALALTAACQMQGGLRPLHDGVSPPPGAARGQQEVDGLVVGHRLMTAGEYELALRAYLRAAAEDGITPEVLASLGTANLKLGRLNQAEQLLRRALDMDPKFVPAMNNLGVVLLAEGKYEEARLVFRNAYALDSGNSDAIRKNLMRAIAKSEKSAYDPEQQNHNYKLERQGYGQYLLVPTHPSSAN